MLVSNNIPYQSRPTFGQIAKISGNAGTMVDNLFLKSTAAGVQKFQIELQALVEEQRPIKDVFKLVCTESPASETEPYVCRIDINDRTVLDSINNTGVISSLEQIVPFYERVIEEYKKVQELQKAISEFHINW